MNARTWKLLELLGEASRFFSEKGIANARLQAELLLAGVLKLRRLDLYLQFDRQLDPAEVEAFRECARQRVRRVPVQYITGEAGFRNLVLAVSQEVLIPRPETEILVGVALEYLAPWAAPRVLDLGCGSGAIAISLACEHDTARVVATDVSLGALLLASRNAHRHSATERVAFLCGDLFDPLAPRPAFDAILSNPPYVRRGDLAGLDPEVRDFEPQLALDGGEDGMVFHRRIVEQAASYLAPHGCLLLEAGDGQAGAVAALFPLAGLELAEVRPDLRGVPRVVVGRPRTG
jgi:release factor glutamine methyltransferase